MKQLVLTFLALCGIAAGQSSTVSPSEVSATGGANKILRADSNGNLKLAPLRLLSDTGSLQSNGGNLILTDRQMIGAFAADSGDGSSPTGDGKMLWRIWHDNAHPNETHHDYNGNFVIYWGMGGVQNGMQLGSAAGGNHYAYWSCGGAESGNTMRQSVPFGFNTATWSGSASVENMMAMQAAPLDTSGTNSAFQFFRNCSLGGAQAINGTKIGELAPAGFWSNGTAPALVTLTDGATITQTCSKYKTVQAAKVTLGGSRTLAISGAEAGMRGVIYVSQDTVGSRTLTLPDGSATPPSWTISTVGGKVDRFEWEFDGTYYYWSQTVGINLPLDSDASAFIAAASITDDTQKSAINNLVISLKASNVSSSGTLWSKTIAAYPFVGGNATAHSKDLKGSYNGSFSGTVTHDANGITGNGSTGYFDTGVKPSNGAQDNAMFYVYSRTAAPTTGKFLFGMWGSGGGYFSLRVNGSNVVSEGPNTTTGSTASLAVPSSDYRTHFALRRSSSTACRIMVGNDTGGTFSVASTGTGARNWYVLAQNNDGSPLAASYSDANIAFAWNGQALDDTEWAAFKAIITSFQTALSRANP